MKLDKYKCAECDRYFTNKFDFRQHGNVHCDEFPFMCAICRELFQTVDDYARHVIHHGTSVNDSAVANSSEADGRAPSNIIQLSEIRTAEPGCENEGELGMINPTNEDGANEGGSRGKAEGSYSSGDEVVSNEGSQPNKRRRERGVSGKGHYCRQCNVKFKTVKKYCEHKKEVHNFFCENCNNRFSSPEKLRKHVCFMSSDGEPFKCSCLLTFTKADDFKIHIGKRPYSCCSCSMQFNRITNLIRHIRTHTKQKPYICKQCGRGFSQSTNLRNHASIHLAVKAVSCDKCNFSCKTLSGLLKHKKKHKDGCMKHPVYVDKRKTSTGVISCPICKKEFPFKRNVGMHIKVHRKKESLCQECGKVFDSKSKLTTHYKACHGVPSVCQKCGKTFASSILLAAHEKIHVSGKKFSCSKCFKTFSIKNYLSQHMKTHSEKKQYSCSKCGKLFKVAVSLKYHSKICITSGVS